MPNHSFREPDAVPRPGLLRRFLGGRRGMVVGAVVAVVAVTAAGCKAAPDLAGSVGDLPSASASAAPTATIDATTAVSVPPSASASPKPSATAKPAGTGWIDVGPEWQQQVDAYKARKIDPAPAGNTGIPEFRADCKFSHQLADDPIVFPGLAGASHMHSFVGNKAVNADTTAADLKAKTDSTCVPSVDHSAYWVPTLYEAGTKKAVETTGFRVYYKSLRQNSSDVMPLPNGLRMIAGDAKKKVPTPKGSPGRFFCALYEAGDVNGIAQSDNGNWPICDPKIGYSSLHFMLQFPDCWDGKHLDSPDHKSHVAFGDDKGCPAAFPIRIPAVFFDIMYPAKGSQAGYYLSSDPEGRSASSMHGDVFVSWDQDAMNKRVKNCIQQRKTCNNDGYDD